MSPTIGSQAICSGMLQMTTGSKYLGKPDNLQQSFLALALLEFGANNSLLLGAVLCIVGCLIASLAYTSQIQYNLSPSAVITTNFSKHCQMSHWEQHCSWLKTLIYKKCLDPSLILVYFPNLLNDHILGFHETFLCELSWA